MFQVLLSRSISVLLRERGEGGERERGREGKKEDGGGGGRGGERRKGGREKNRAADWASKN